MTPAATELDTMALKRVMDGISPYLEQRELVADDLLLELRAIVRGQPQIPLLARLLGQIDRFDHDGALATIAQLVAKLNLEG